MTSWTMCFLYRAELQGFFKAGLISACNKGLISKGGYMTQKMSHCCLVAKTEVKSSSSKLQAPCQNNHLSPTKWKRIRIEKKRKNKINKQKNQALKI